MTLSIGACRRFAGRRKQTYKLICHREGAISIDGFASSPKLAA